MTKIASNLQIDSARLWDTIHETAKFGATAKGGVRRLTLGPEDKQVRDWFRSACEAAGLEVHVDALGSMFGLRKGRDMSKPPVGLGSHLDTQPTGGKFDGVLGTLAALEVVRTLNDAGIVLDDFIALPLATTTRTFAGAAVFDVEQRWLDARHAAQQRELAMNARVRTRDAGDRQAHGLDPA